MSEKFGTCLGTRNIKICEENKESSNALLAVFQCDSRIGIKIANDSAAFACIIDPSDSSEFSSAELIAQFFLSNEMDGVSLAFDLVADSLKAVIRRRLGTGLVKMLWTGVLKKCPTGILGVLRSLGNTINDDKKEFNRLNEQHEKLATDLRCWKDTAGKLEGGWQNEKDSLLENFLSIYKVTHEELRKTKLNLQRLENRKEIASHENEVVVDNQKRRTKATRDMPDDHDELIYDIDTVNRLAAGPRRNANINEKKIVAKKPEVPPVRPCKNTTTNIETCQKMVIKPPQSTSTGNSSLSVSAHEVTVLDAEAVTIAGNPVVSQKNDQNELEIEATQVKEPLNQFNKTKFSSKPCASLSRKKPKISDLIDEEKRKQLEHFSALLSDDDSDDGW